MSGYSMSRRLVGPKSQHDRETNSRLEGRPLIAAERTRTAFTSSRLSEAKPEQFPSNAGSSLASSSAEDGCMQFDDSKSGDHLQTGPDKSPAVVANIPERQGVTGHNVRYVLFFGLAAVVIAFAAVLVSYLA
jgi:hypothetical protein